MDRIICSLLCDCLFPPLLSKFSFRCIQTVYTAYEHCNCLEFHWNMTYGTWLPRYWTFQQIYIRCTLHIDWNSDIFISRGWYSEVYASYFILILYDCAVISTHFHCIYSLYTVYTVCWHSHMGLHVYDVYIGFHFSRLVIRPLDIYASSNITFPIVPVARGCLLVGSTPGPQ